MFYQGTSHQRKVESRNMIHGKVYDCHVFKIISGLFVNIFWHSFQRDIIHDTWIHEYMINGNVYNCHVFEIISGLFVNICCLSF